MRSDSAPELLTAKEVADRLRVSLATVGRWRRDGVIRGFQINGKKQLFRADDIDRLIPGRVDEAS